MLSFYTNLVSQGTYLKCKDMSSIVFSPFFANMYSAPRLAAKFLKYYITASNGKGHGIHSPFVFEFVTQVLNDSRQFYAYDGIEQLRQQMRSNNELLTIDDFGAGSRVAATKQRSVSSIAASALKPKKFSQLFFKIVNHYQPQTIVELGTSLGITTSYLAAANQKGRVVTMEGAKAVAAVAKQNFEALGLTNIEVVQGNFDDTLPVTLQRLSKVDFAYVDGNHRKEPTLRYFNQLLPYLHAESILIFDDVHWSEEMEQAWETIKADKRVLMTIDLFFIGLVFFKEEFKVKQDFVIRF